PKACAEQLEVAEKAFRNQWLAYLIEPVETTVAKPDLEKNMGKAKGGSAYLAPVGSYRIVAGEWTLTNRMASAFIHCEKREGYVRARGGVADREAWYGPFKF
ncbi:MAG: hypothetical protein ACREWI_07300, partial [Telluria sp.]